MQIHGGMGYAEEFPVSRYFVDARVLSIFEGADEGRKEIQKQRAAMRDWIASSLALLAMTSLTSAAKLN